MAKYVYTIIRHDTKAVGDYEELSAWGSYTTKKKAYSELTRLVDFFLNDGCSIVENSEFSPYKDAPSVTMLRNATGLFMDFVISANVLH